MLQRGAEKMHAHREPAPRFSSHAWRHLGKRRRAMRDMHPSSRSHVTADRANEICTAGMESIKIMWGSASNAAALAIQIWVLSQITYSLTRWQSLPSGTKYVQTQLMIKAKQLSDIRSSWSVFSPLLDLSCTVMISVSLPRSLPRSHSTPSLVASPIQKMDPKY